MLKLPTPIKSRVSPLIIENNKLCYTYLIKPNYLPY